METKEGCHDKRGNRAVQQICELRQDRFDAGKTKAIATKVHHRRLPAGGDLKRGFVQRRFGRF